MRTNIILLLLIFAWHIALTQDSLERLANGRMIFQTNCSPCHGVHKEIQGPMLGSITKKKSKAWIIAFITNSQNVIASGDAYANYLAEQYHHAVMPSFTQFTPAMMNDLLLYLDNESVHPTERIVTDAENYDQYIQDDVLRGRQLFQEQCASCHAITKEAYGPALGSVTKRHPYPWLAAFIRNSQQVIKNGDPYATDLFNRFDTKVMVSMEFLKDEDIKDILRYIEFTSSSPSFMGGANGLRQKASPNPVVGDDPVIHDDACGEKKFFKYFFAILGTVGLFVLSHIVVKFYRFLSRGLREDA